MDSPIVPQNTTAEKCEIASCPRAPQFNLAGIKVGGTHFRIFVVGEFGERADPPFSRERMLEVLVADGVDRDEAEKPIEQHFRERKRGKF